MEVGYFGSAERLVSAGLSIMAPLGAIFIPKVTVLFDSNKTIAFQYLRRILLGLICIGLTGFLISFLGATQIIHLIFGDAFTGSINILKVLAIIFPFYATTLVLSAYLLIPLHHDALLGKVVLFGAFTNIAAAIVLGGAYGGVGMAWARVISEVLVFILLMFHCKRLGLIKQLFESSNIQKESTV